MPKMKTHKGTAKVCNKRKNDVKIGRPGSRHNTGKKNAAANRKKRSGSTLASGDMKRLKDLIK